MSHAEDALTRQIEVTCKYEAEVERLRDQCHAATLTIDQRHASLVTALGLPEDASHDDVLFSVINLRSALALSHNEIQKLHALLDGAFV